MRSPGAASASTSTGSTPGIAGNAAYLVPHGVVRALVVGWDDVPATAADIAAMQEIVRTAMAEGAVGLSAGLTYTPGMYADNAELLALCTTVGELRRLLRPAPPLLRRGRAGGVRGDDRPRRRAPAARCTSRTPP